MPPTAKLLLLFFFLVLLLPLTAKRRALTMRHCPSVYVFSVFIVIVSVLETLDPCLKHPEKITTPQ